MAKDWPRESSLQVPNYLQNQWIPLEEEHQALKYELSSHSIPELTRRNSLQQSFSLCREVPLLSYVFIKQQALPVTKRRENAMHLVVQHEQVSSTYPFPNETPSINQKRRTDIRQIRQANTSIKALPVITSQDTSILEGRENPFIIISIRHIEIVLQKKLEVLYP